MTAAFWHFLSAKDYNTNLHNDGIKNPTNNNQINQT